MLNKNGHIEKETVTLETVEKGINALTKESSASANAVSTEKPDSEIEKMDKFLAGLFPSTETTQNFEGTQKGAVL